MFDPSADVGEEDVDEAGAVAVEGAEVAGGGVGVDAGDNDVLVVESQGHS